MSYLSATENVGFNGIPQTISDASCATQYKMAVDGVSGNCGDVNMFIHDSSGDEHTYITHLNDNFFHTKFKIDPNELYTFHDSDVIAGEITVSHTEDNYTLPENDVKTKLLESPSIETDLITSLTNGEVKEKVKKEVISNGHCLPKIKSLSTGNYRDVTIIPTNSKDSKITNAKVPKAKTQNQVKEPKRTNSVEIRRPSVHSPKGPSIDNAPSCSKSSITSVNNSISSNNGQLVTVIKPSGMETFLDVFKREQGLVENSPPVKTEIPVPPTPPPKIPAATPKKTASAGKTPSQAKPRRGRGPAVHEALQRIPPQRRAVPLANHGWHAPGDDLFQCGPLDDRKPVPFSLETSSSDDDIIPDFDAGVGPICVEETAVDSRGARLALRRAALRRRVVYADASLRLARDSPHITTNRRLAAIVKKQLQGQGRLPAQTVNYLLASHGMPAMLTSQERRRLREDGWSGGESGSTAATTGSVCIEERCTQPPLPCGRYCLAHATQAPEQRLYAPCAAVFAGGTRCMQPLLPLQEQTPLCMEHAWKRDNYDKLSRDARPKKPAPVRRRAPPPAARAPRPARPQRPLKRRRRPPVKTIPSSQSLTDMKVCSNSSAYDSSEDTAIGTLSENEYVVTGSNSHELEVEVGHVPPDDILDPAVLSQIPDEAFTEFFNEAEEGTFAESSELAAALEAVLDERVLDERSLDTIAECVFTPQQVGKSKIQAVPAAATTQPSAPS